MKEIYVRFQNHDFEEIRKRRHFQKKESAIIEFDSRYDEVIKLSMLSILTNQSSRLTLKLTADQLSELGPHLQRLKKMQLYGLCLTTPMKARKETDENKATDRYTDISKKSEAFKFYTETTASYADQFLFTPELLLSPDSLGDLFDTLLGFSQLNIPWVILNPILLDLDRDADAVAKALEMYRIYANPDMDIYYSPNHPLKEEWNAKTLNIFRGPRYIDIDVSNACTHNCVFCGLYNDQTMEKHKKAGNGVIPEHIKTFMSTKIDQAHCLDLIASLGEETTTVQFGGLGDPFTHPHILEFYRAARERNFQVTSFSNFAYMTKESIDQLHDLASGNAHAIHFIINLSAASAKTYCENRPSQKPEVFENIIKNMTYASELVRRDNRGLSFCLMSVTNKLNFKDIPDLVALAKTTGALDLWIKPIEVHGAETLPYLVEQKDYIEYARLLKLALYFAKMLDVELKDVNVIHSIVDQYKNELETLEQKRSFLDQVDDFINISSLMQEALLMKDHPGMKEYFRLEKIYFFGPEQVYPERYESFLAFKKAPIDLSKLEAAENDLGVVNGGTAAAFYDQYGCHIGMEYIRIGAASDVLGCCISKYPMGVLGKKSLKDIWFGDQYAAFRNRMEKIHLEKFHRLDPKWFFCQQCPHLNINADYNKNLKSAK